jgi:hypothetical protein
MLLRNTGLAQAVVWYPTAHVQQLRFADAAL